MGNSVPASRPMVNYLVQALQVGPTAWPGVSGALLLGVRHFQPRFFVAAVWTGQTGCGM